MVDDLHREPMTFVRHRRLAVHPPILPDHPAPTNVTVSRKEPARRDPAGVFCWCGWVGGSTRSVLCLWLVGVSGLVVEGGDVGIKIGHVAVGHPEIA